MAGHDIVGEAAAARFSRNALNAFAWKGDGLDVEAMVAVACVRPEASFEGYMAANCPETYEALEELPEDLLFTANASTVTSFRDCCRGMAALKTPLPFNTRDAWNLSGMYAGCASLAENFPYIINCAAVESIAGLAGIFEGSGVKCARFENVCYPVRFQMTKANLGSQMERIVINGIFGGIRD